MNPVAPVTSVLGSGVIVFRSLPATRTAVPASPQTAVVVDSTSYLPEELIRSHGIHLVSLYVTLEGEQRPELEISGTQYAPFFERLQARAPTARRPLSPPSANFRIRLCSHG